MIKIYIIELIILVMQVRVMVHGQETVLGDAASDHEIFMTNVHYECPATDALHKCKATHLQVSLT